VQETSQTRTQFGALCWRRHGEVLLVTSRDTGRWVIPKGWPCDGLGPDGSAAREAWEEAGVEGQIDPRCLGVFSYEKAMLPQPSVPCIVGVYGLRVQKLQRRFPERRERRRKWFTLDKAARKVAEPELRELMLTMKSVLETGDPMTTPEAT
jgi:8-oxo-dGTP pyrophosphatase MutT (NUDIX family)